MITGTTFPAKSLVRALNCLQNSMMLTPFAPNAGPMGGAGFAAPPFIWSLMTSVISFAMFLKYYVLCIMYYEGKHFHCTLYLVLGTIFTLSLPAYIQARAGFYVRRFLPSL